MDIFITSLCSTRKEIILDPKCVGFSRYSYSSRGRLERGMEASKQGRKAEMGKYGGSRLTHLEREGGIRIASLAASPPTDCSFATKVGELRRTILPQVTPG